MPCVLSTMRLSRELSPYINTTSPFGMHELWASAVASGRFLSLMSRFSGAHSKCRLVQFIHRVAVQTARRPRTEIGAKADLPDPSVPDAVVHSVGFGPRLVIHRGAPPRTLR